MPHTVSVTDIEVVVAHPERATVRVGEVFLKIDTQGYEPQVLAGAGALLGRLLGIQLEMSLVPIYEGERDFRTTLDELAAAGFEPYLLLPGYFERRLARQLQVDGVFMRPGAARADP